jgi:hypothetical protein
MVGRLNFPEGRKRAEALYLAAVLDIGPLQWDNPSQTRNSCKGDRSWVIRA